MRRAWLFAFLALTACGRSSQVPNLDAGVTSDSLSRARLQDVVRLARPVPAWAAALTGRSDVLTARVDGFANGGHDDAAGGVPTAFGAHLPSFADGGIGVRAGNAGLVMHVRDARGAATLVDGDVVYRDAHTATDLVIAAAAGRVELFWLLRDASAPSAFTLTLDLDGLTPRIDDGVVFLVDDHRLARVRIPRPSAIDANGVRRTATMTLEGTTLTIALDRRDLAFPILLDPALEQVAWTDVGLKVPSWPPPGSTSYSRITVPAGLQRVSGSARSNSNVVYLFGGANIYGNNSYQAKVYEKRLFEWNGTSWSASTGGEFTDTFWTGDPEKATDDRISDIAYDSVRNKLVMFGGYTFGPAEPRIGVHEYTPGVGWAKVCADGPPCYDTVPTWAASPSAVFAFNRAILVHASGTFQWNPTSKLLEKFAATPDLKRSGAALAYDTVRNRLVAYGDNTGKSDTWETNSITWTQVLTTGPLGVKNASLTYHPTRARVMLWASSSSTSGLWSWNGAAWTAIAVDGTGPAARPNAAFAYDQKNGKLVLFGGGDLGGSSPSNCFDNPWSTPFDSNKDFRTCARVDTWTSQIFGGSCTATSQCESGQTCVDGVCCQTTCSGTCKRCDATGSVGKCTTVTSAVDPDTCTGDSSCDSAGSCRKLQGNTCAIGTDCLTGNCADGYCCDTSCAGSCEACNLSGKLGTCSPLTAGSTGKSCGTYTCPGTASTCLSACTSDVQCAPTAYCNSSGACVTQLLKGVTCARNRQCATGACVDGVCCDSACSGTCDVCSASLGATANGTCTILGTTAAPSACGPARCSGTSAACGTTCVTDSDCSTTGYCTGGACAVKRKQGESCDRAAHCESGLSCADGVCCNEACDGACRACSALNKASGDKSGECGAAKEGTNPGAKCVKSLVTTCGSSGLCNATGSCAVYSAGTPCGPSGSTTCDGDTVKGQTCDGLGTCAIDTIGTPCAPGKCESGACKLTCAADGDCAADAYCTAGTCKKKATAGAKCSVDAQCASGFCADSVCCNARCERACEACDQTGTVGTCTAVTGKPRLGHPACAAGDPTNPCSAAACDGVERASCAKKAGTEVACRTSSCDGDVETLAATCDGSGSCPAAETRPCQPFACGTDACKKSCATDGDCKSGFVCNSATGACTAGDKCVGSVVTRVDGTTVDCAPYTCESSGKCKTSCATTAECIASKICNGNTCVDPVAPIIEDGGGCAVSSRGVSSGAMIVLAVAIAAALRRRGLRRLSACSTRPA
jgi:hypothetical protein